MKYNRITAYSVSRVRDTARHDTATQIKYYNYMKLERVFDRLKFIIFWWFLGGLGLFQTFLSELK